MATLHIFNPEHDIALAANLSNFTSPHAGRQLRHDLGFLPAIWAGNDDVVLVENVADAQRDFARATHQTFDGFVDKHQLAKLAIDHVEPWGWDLALRNFLLRYGVKVVPSEEAIGVIRDLSHRKHAVGLLEALQGENTVGKSWCTDTLQQVEELVRAYRQVVVKAPWSSSGRGVRFIDNALNDYQARWIQNTMASQGSVVVEIYQNKVKDFGMEFESDGKGNVRYLGLSLFHTQNGAYTGNVLATEEEKLEKISRYIPVHLLNNIQEKICAILGPLYREKYAGPFGVDMMVVSGDDHRHFLLNPCVEINLRRTMGHVALALSKQVPSGYVMRIDYTENTYKLRIQQT